MNYIDLLTQEEKSILCGIITGRDFKELFKRNEQEFSKIRKGFRAKSLTEQQALSIAIVNVDKPFIAMWANTKVKIWLKEIQENIEGLAYASLEINELTEAIADPQKGIAISEGLKRDLQYVLGEF